MNHANPSSFFGSLDSSARIEVNETPTDWAPVGGASAPVANAYTRHKILTASPEQLQLMLYDGAIRFAQTARTALEERQFEKAQFAFEKADAILTELTLGLRPEIDPELCDKYASLYNFCSRRLLEANYTHKVSLIDDAIRILQHLRETWVEVLEAVAADRASQARERIGDDVRLTVET